LRRAGVDGARGVVDSANGGFGEVDGASSTYLESRDIADPGADGFVDIDGTVDVDGTVDIEDDTEARDTEDAGVAVRLDTENKDSVLGVATDEASSEDVRGGRNDDLAHVTCRSEGGDGGSGSIGALL
jgi:hypothetical protein